MPELFFFFFTQSFDSVVGLGDYAPLDKIQSTGRLDFLLEMSEINLGLTHMFLGLRRQTQ